MLVYDEEMGEFYNLAPIEEVSAGGGTRYLLNSGDGIWCGSEFPQTMPPLERHRVIPCPPPPRIAAALELVEAMKEHMAYDPLNVAHDAGYVETWKTMRSIMRKIQELDKPEPVKDEADTAAADGPTLEERVRIIDQAQDKIIDRVAELSSLVSTLIDRHIKIAEELAAMKGGGK